MFWLIEPKPDCRFWLAGQGRPAAPDPSAAMTQLAVAKVIAQQFGGIIGIIGHRFAEVFCASAFLLCHGIPH